MRDVSIIGIGQTKVGEHWERGLADLRVIIAGAPRFLRDGGLLALETGIAHHDELAKMAAAAGFGRTESRPDLTGRDRFFFAARQ